MLLLHVGAQTKSGQLKPQRKWYNDDFTCLSSVCLF